MALDEALINRNGGRTLLNIVGAHGDVMKAITCRWQVGKVAPGKPLGVEAMAMALRDD